MISLNYINSLHTKYSMCFLRYMKLFHKCYLDELRLKMYILLLNLVTNCLPRICLSGNLFTNSLPSNWCTFNNTLYLNMHLYLLAKINFDSLNICFNKLNFGS